MSLDLQGLNQAKHLRTRMCCTSATSVTSSQRSKITLTPGYLQSTLKFSCICADGSVPDVSPYIQTVPFYVCEETYGQCINAHPNDAEGQRACKDAATCGTKNASAEDTTMSSTTTAASTTLAMATSTGSSETTSSVAAASTTTNAAAALSGLEGYSTGLMAGAMFLAARLFL